MPCDTCLLWTGRHVEHAECPIKADLVCRRCCGSGHTTSECDFAPEIHPTHLEELIPHDVRERYGITTRTEYVRPPVPVEPHPIRCIVKQFFTGRTIGKQVNRCHYGINTLNIVWNQQTSM